MTPNEYQTQAARTLIDAPPRPLTSAEHMIVWNAIGLAGEAGEVLGLTECTAAVRLARAACGVAEFTKKGIFHEKGLDVLAVQALLGEVLHYTALLWSIPGAGASETINVAPLEKELGDVLWYTAALCTKLDLSLGTLWTEQTRIFFPMCPLTALDDVMAANITKLQARFPAGWSTVDAAARADEQVTV